MNRTLIEREKIYMYLNLDRGLRKLIDLHICKSVILIR